MICLSPFLVSKYSSYYPFVREVMANISSHSVGPLFILLLLILWRHFEFDFIPTSQILLLFPAITGPLLKPTAPMGA